MTEKELSKMLTKNPDLLTHIGIGTIIAKADFQSFGKEREQRWLAESIMKELVNNGLIQFVELHQDNGTVKMSAEIWVVDMARLNEAAEQEPAKKPVTRKRKVKKDEAAD